MDWHIVVVHFSASLGLPVRDVYEMTPGQLYKYGDIYTEKMNDLKDSARFIVFEGVRNANSDKVKKFEPLFTKLGDDTDNGPATEEELKSLKDFLHKK